jgi:ParB-like nuclease domain
MGDAVVKAGAAPGAGAVVTGFPVDDLIEDFSLYPRNHISDFHVMEIVHAINGGFIPPPVVACRRTKRMVEGYHRRRAYQKLGIPTIPVEFRTYRDDTEHWKDAVALQPNGLNFTPRDQLRIMQISMEKFSLSEEFTAQLMRTSVSHLRKIKPRYASVGEARDKSPELRRRPGRTEPEKRSPAKVHLKGSTRHLSGRTITRSQADANEGAPGVSYLLLVNQLISAFQNDLLPPPGQHPRLWERMEVLGDEIDRVFSESPAV